MKTSLTKFFVLPFTALVTKHDCYEHKEVRKIVNPKHNRAFADRSFPIFSLLKSFINMERFGKIYRELMYDKDPTEGKDVNEKIYNLRKDYFMDKISNKEFFERLLVGFGSDNEKLVDILTILRSTPSEANVKNFVSLISKSFERGVGLIIPVCMSQEFFQRTIEPIFSELPEIKLLFNYNPYFCLISSFNEETIDLNELTYKAILKQDIDRKGVKIISLDSRITSEAVSASNAEIITPFSDNNLWYEHALWSLKDENTFGGPENDKPKESLMVISADAISSPEPHARTNSQSINVDIDLTDVN